MSLYSIALSNLRRRLGKAVLLVLGLTLGIATFVVLRSLGTAMRDEVGAQMDQYGANIVITPESDSLSLSYGGVSVGGITVQEAALTEGDLARLKNMRNWANISAIAPKLIEPEVVQGRKMLVAGVDFASELKMKKWWHVVGSVPADGTDVLLGSEAARQTGAKAGDSLSITGRSFTVAGTLVETGGPDDGLIFADLHALQELAGKPGKLSLAEVSALCTKCPIDAMVGQIRDQIPGARVVALSQAMHQRMEMVGTFEKFSVGITLVVLLIGALLVFVVVTASVNERTREIGVFRSLGFRRSHICRILLTESALLGTASGLLGAVVGFVGTLVARPTVVSSATTAFSFDPALALTALSVGVSLSLAASLYPTLKAANLDPTESLRAI